MNWHRQAGKILGFLLAPLLARSAIEPIEARRRQEAGASLVDVRSLDEWDEGHARDARHIPLGQLGAQLADFSSDHEVVFICYSGARSAIAARRARRAGLTAVTHVRGGMIRWEKSGLPVEGPDS